MFIDKKVYRRLIRDGYAVKVDFPDIRKYKKYIKDDLTVTTWLSVGNKLHIKFEGRLNDYDIDIVTYRQFMKLFNEYFQ